MTFSEWILSSYPNPSKNGQWGLLHILVLLLCVATILTATFLLRKKSTKAKRIYFIILASLILVFEITRRIINLYKATNPTFNSIMYILLPRPWCAIACWSLMLSVIINNRNYYNFCSITALLTALIFFAYPSVGFNNQYILFENLYSIATHSLLLIMSISLITLRFVKFEYKSIWKEIICFGVVLLYAFVEIYLLKIEADPMYFMPNNDVQTILGLSYTPFIIVYVLFLLFYFNVFYIIDDRKVVFKKYYKKNAD